MKGFETDVRRETCRLPVTAAAAGASVDTGNLVQAHQPAPVPAPQPIIIQRPALHSSQ